MQNEIEKLIELFSSFPSIGKKTAARIVIDLITNKKSHIPNFINSFDNAYKAIKHCEICANIDVTSPCKICQDEKRANNVICVVENIEDLWAIENSNIYRGKYHVLGGTLSAVRGIGPEDLNITSLTKRLNGEVEELIIAINSGLDGQTTGYFLSDMYQDKVKKISKLGYGLPVGSEIGYLDEGTLGAAFDSRKAV